MRTNPSTPFTAQGMSDIVNDIRTLFLAVGNGANDMNFNSVALNQDAADGSATALQRAQNLKDLTDVNAAQANLGISTAIAAVSSGTTGAFLRIANNLSDVASLSGTQANLGIFPVESPVNFHAYGSTTQNVAGANEVLAFDTERSDVGGFYSTSTFKYTPSAGKYLIGFTVLLQQSISGFATDINTATLDFESGVNYGKSVVAKTAINTDYSLSQVAFATFNGSNYVRVTCSPDATFYSNNTVTLREFWGVRISA